MPLGVPRVRYNSLNVGLYLISSPKQVGVAEYLLREYRRPYSTQRYASTKK